MFISLQTDSVGRKALRMGDGIHAPHVSLPSPLSHSSSLTLQLFQKRSQELEESPGWSVEEQTVPGFQLQLIFQISPEPLKHI